MTKDEALKLALEALEEIKRWTERWTTPGHPVSTFAEKAIAPLKKALAEQPVQQEPVAHKQEFVSPGGGYVPAIPAQQPTQQEPVAYMSHNKENFVSADDVGNSVPNWTDYYPTPLYTTPPPCPTCEALARTVMMDQIGRDA